MALLPMFKEVLGDKFDASDLVSVKADATFTTTRDLTSELEGILQGPATRLLTKQHILIRRGSEFHQES